jgi:hypothetical protein
MKRTRGNRDRLLQYIRMVSVSIGLTVLYRLLRHF